MKTKISSTVALVLIGLFSFAQSPSDALMFSQTFNGGTARFVGMGGAFGALGGDFSSLTYNPAGLGVYRSSEFTITPSFKNRTVSSDYNGSNGKDSRSRFNFDNLGFVLSFKPNKEAERGLINFNVAFGYNRTNDYFTNSRALGDNSANSMMDYFAGLANGNNSNDLWFPEDSQDDYNPFFDSQAPWEAVMAWNTYLIDTKTGSNTDYRAMLNEEDGVFQSKRSSNTGSTGEYVLSIGTNFSYKLFIGATLGITNINYTTKSTYSEDAFDENGNLTNGDRFWYFDYMQTLETNGSGYNFKVGAIYKPFEGLRLGLAMHTPTYYKLEDTYSYTIHSNFDYQGAETNFYSDSPNSRYEYKLETPFKAIASAAYTFKDIGLLSIDVEHAKYSAMKFRDGGDGYDYTYENDDIQYLYKSVYNMRIGGEVRINDFFLRGGYAYYPSPYKKGFLNENANRSIVSSGIGYRSGNFFIDAAYLYSIQREKYIFYDLNDVNPVSTKMTEGKCLVTVGIKF